MPKTPYLYQNPFAINWEKNSKKSKFKHEIKKYKEQSYFFSIKRYILLALVWALFRKKVLQNLKIQNYNFSKDIPQFSHHKPIQIAFHYLNQSNPIFPYIDNTILPYSDNTIPPLALHPLVLWILFSKSYKWQSTEL